MGRNSAKNKVFDVYGTSNENHYYDIIYDNTLQRIEIVAINKISQQPVVSRIDIHTVYNPSIVFY